MTFPKTCCLGLLPALILLSTVPCSTAQIDEERDYHGEKIMCMLSGLRGWGEDCGIDGDYAYIFRGTVFFVTDTSDAEEELELAPIEIFRGDPVSQLTVITNQGHCLPEILPGDEWLFYLWRDDKSNQLVLSYGGGSAPVSDAAFALSELRRLAVMTDTGIIRGELNQPIEREEDGFKFWDYVPVPNHQVVATRSDGTIFSAISDSQGRYAFEPLPSASYYLSANTEPGLWAEEGPAKVEPRSCRSFQLEMHTDGQISGRVRSADGRPFKIHPWVEIQTEDGNRTQSFDTDEHGYFYARGLEPGRYRVSVGDVEPNAPDPGARVYYPGVRSKEQATVIDLGKAEKRANIDFQLPAAASP
jgi:hypothetical protein